MEKHQNCPEGRLLKEGFLPFFIHQYNYGESLEYDPLEVHPLFNRIDEKINYNCRTKNTTIPPHSQNVSDTIILYDQSKDIKLFGVFPFYYKIIFNTSFLKLFDTINPFLFLFFIQLILNNFDQVRMVGSGYCFGLNIPTDYIPKQIAFNAISIACAFPREWSTEKHKHFSTLFRKIIFNLLLSFQRHKKNKTLSVPPKPIQILIVKQFSLSHKII